MGGNPDRQGEAGAYELIMNPWAKSAGLHTINTAGISGVDAMRLNVAGIARVNNFEGAFSNAQYLRGADIQMNAAGLVTKVGENGALGLSLMALDFGDLVETTVLQPEGTGSTFSPNYFNIGIGYSYLFENKVSVGFTVRLVSESIADIQAFGLALDAGVQYVTGPKDNFKFGISLRNIGAPMTFSGEGLSTRLQNSSGDFEVTVDQRAETFELPTTLNIGASYDFYIGELHRLTVMGNFTGNTFQRDAVAGGVEYSLKELFTLRTAYRYEFGGGSEDQFIIEKSVYSGLAAGASVGIPLSKRDKEKKLYLDYAFRATKVFDGTHNFGLRINI